MENKRVGREIRSTAVGSRNAPQKVAQQFGGKGAWLAALRLPLAVIAGISALVVVSCESNVFGECYLPSLGLGIVTIVWAVIASALRGRMITKED